jgi:hypothetical protein
MATQEEAKKLEAAWLKAQAEAKAAVELASVAYWAWRDAARKSDDQPTRI